MIETKEDLLRVMREFAACSEATDWVSRQSGTAGEIWARCVRADWLIWLAVRLRPITAKQLAYWCADRAVRTYAADALDRAGITHELRGLAPIVDTHTAGAAAAAAAAAASAAAYAADAADAAASAARAARAAHAYADAADAAAYAYADAADAAAYAYADAADAAAAYAAERARQLGALHRLWPRLANKR